MKELSIHVLVKQHNFVTRQSMVEIKAIFVNFYKDLSYAENENGISVDGMKC